MIEGMMFSLALTIVIEVILIILIGIGNENNIESIIWINCLTNPVVVGLTNLVYILFKSILIRNIVLIFLEIVVLHVEAIMLKKNITGMKMKPLFYSLYLNGISFGIGIVINFIS